MTQEEFAQTIRTKYPDATTSDGRNYADVPTEELVQKIVTKYPVYGKQIDDFKGELPQRDRTFVEELIPAGFAVGGGILGGAAGALAGGVGAIPGAIAGSAAGGALGETLLQKKEKESGTRVGYDPEQIAISGATSALFEGGGRLAMPILKHAVSAGVNVARSPVVSLMAKLSGYGDDVVKTALQRTSGAVETVKGGEGALNDIVTRSAQGISKFANQTLKESQQKIAEFSSLSGGGKGYPGTRQALLTQGSKFVSNITSKLRSNYNIGVKAGDQLTFGRPSLPSRIVTGGDQNALQTAFNTVKGLTNDTSIKNIDAILERLIVLKSKTPAGSPTGGETKKIITEMMEQVIGFTKSLGKTHKSYSEYVKFLETNLPKRVLINEAKELFSTSANLSAKEVSQITSKLLQMFNTGKLAIREEVGKIGQEIGEDIVGGAAGTLLQTGDQFSVRAANLTQRGMVEKVAEFIPRAAIKNYVATGKVTGELLNNPVLKFIGNTFGITTETILRDLVNLQEGKSSQ